MSARKQLPFIGNRVFATYLPLFSPSQLFLFTPGLGAAASTQVNIPAREGALDEDIDERCESAVRRKTAEAGDERLRRETQLAVPRSEAGRVAGDDELNMRKPSVKASRRWESACELTWDLFSALSTSVPSLPAASSYAKK